jgi:hypothetical protein
LVAGSFFEASGFGDIMKTRGIFVLLVLLTLVRGVWVALHEIAPQEAYYWLCSTRLAPAFFDGPPGTAFLVAICNSVDGPSMLIARLLWPALGLLASVFAWVLAKELFDETTAGWTVVGLNVLPVFNASAVMIGPVLPALLFVLAGAWSVRRAWAGHGNFWALAGVFFAGAALFRYDAVLVPAGLLIVTLASPRHRARIDIAGCVWIVLAVVLALWMPAVWNAGLEWIPMAGGTLRTAWEFRWIGFPAAVGAGGVTLAAALVLLAGGIWLVRDARRHEKSRFLLAAGGLSVLAWIYLALRGVDPVGGALFGSVPVLIFLATRASQSRLGGIIALGVCVVLAGISVSAGIRSADDRAAWRPLADAMKLAVRDMPAGEGEGFFIAEDPDAAAMLGWILKPTNAGGPPPVFVPESPGLPDQFGLWPSYADFVESPVVTDEYYTEQKGVNPFIGRHALYVGPDLPQTIAGAFEQVDPLQTITLPGGRTFTIYLCLSYQTLPL